MKNAETPDEVTLKDCAECIHRPAKRGDHPRVFILRNHLCPGDVLCMTAAVHSLHQAHPGKFVTAVETSCPSVWDHNPNVVPVEEAREMGAEEVEMHYPLINQSNQRLVHVLAGYCQFLEDNLRLPVPLATNRPHVYVSREEVGWTNQVEQEFGCKGGWWLLNAGAKKDFTAKQWAGYQQVVDLLQGKVLFVQVGKAEHLHRPLRGVLNLIGRTDDRQLIRLAWHAQGALCGTTFLMHLMAALEKPAVILAGGREPRAWNSYPLQTLFSTVGTLSCCRKEACWRSRVVKLGDGSEQDGSLCEQPVPTDPPSPRCLALIEPAEVAAAVLRYETCP